MNRDGETPVWVHSTECFPLSTGAVRIVSSPFMSRTEPYRVQVRFPRSKKRRIRRKWAKDQRNWTTMLRHPVCVIRDTIFAHPDVVEMIKRGSVCNFPPASTNSKGD